MSAISQHVRGTRISRLKLAGHWVEWLASLSLLGTGVFMFAAGHLYEGLASLSSLAILWLLHFLTRRIFPGRLRHVVQIVTVLYLLEATIFGTVLHLYDKVPYYDKVNHGVVGTIVAMIGLLVFYWLNPGQRQQLNVRPGFVATFCIGFTAMFKVLWEFYEFSADRLFNTNMQGWQHGGIVGLIDTMTDLAAGLACALLVSLIASHQLKKDAQLFYSKFIRGFFDPDSKP